MDDFEHLFTELKQLSNDITEANYYDYGKQGYDILVRIHDMGISKGDTYNVFLQYYDGLQDGLSKAWIGDMLDYISGWCNPEKHSWRDDATEVSCLIKQRS